MVRDAGRASLFFSSRRRHTRYWRDWEFRRVLFRSAGDPGDAEPGRLGELAGGDVGVGGPDERVDEGPGDQEIGRASCRERGKISGVAVSLKKKHTRGA